MKSEIKFNHDKELLSEALGLPCTPDEMVNMVGEAVIEWSKDERGSMTSLLAEHIHNTVPYEVILCIATREVIEQVKTSVDDSEKMSELMRTLDMIIEEQVRRHDKTETERKMREN
jgi:hypothetical protein